MMLYDEAAKTKAMGRGLSVRGTKDENSLE